MSSRRGGRLLRGSLLAAAVAAVVALDTGVVPLPYSTPVPPEAVAARSVTTSAERAVRAREAAVEAATGAMTAAYAAGDEKAFLAVVDAADSALVGRLRTRFRNLRAIGYQDVSFGWPDRRTFPVPADRPYAAASRTSPTGPVVAAIEVRTRVPGFDAKTSSSVVGLTFAARGERWLVVGDADADDELETYTASEPWMLGAVYVARRPNVLVIGEPKRKQAVERLATRVETAVAAVRSAWKVSSWNGKAVVYATTDRRFVDAQFNGHDARDTKDTKGSKEAVFDAKVTRLLGAAVFSDSDLPPETVPRMVVTPYLLGRDTAEARAVLRHELTHVAFSAEGGESVPSWLVEGIAEYTGYRTGGASVDGVGALGKRGLPRATWTQLRRGTWKPTLVVEPSEFYGGSAEHVAATYTTAWLTCMYIADRYGEQALAKLYRAAGKAPAEDDPEAVEAAILKSVLKTDRAKLSRGTTSYARRIRSRFV